MAAYGSNIYGIQEVWGFVGDDDHAAIAAVPTFSIPSFPIAGDGSGDAVDTVDVVGYDPKRLVYGADNGENDGAAVVAMGFNCDTGVVDAVVDAASGTAAVGVLRCLIVRILLVASCSAEA